MNPFTVFALLAVVTVLTMVQVPLDIQTHRLSRRATFLSTVGIAAIVLTDAWLAEVANKGLASVLVASVIVGVYGFVHRVSSNSLGWGDVLLVAPLTLAVAYVAIELVLWWQLLAAVTGALHAVTARTRGVRSYVPYGPHLLAWAWLMLAASV